MATTRNIEAMSVHPNMATYYSWEAPEAATQTFLLGAVLIYSAGFIQEAGADPTVIAGIALRAGQSGGSAGAKNSHFSPLLPGVLIEANLSQAAASTVLAATDYGKLYGIIKRTAGTTHWVIDSSDVTNTRVRVLRAARDHVVGDTDARVLAVVIAANSAFSA